MANKHSLMNDGCSHEILAPFGVGDIDIGTMM